MTTRVTDAKKVMKLRRLGKIGVIMAAAEKWLHLVKFLSIMSPLLYLIEKLKPVSKFLRSA